MSRSVDRRARRSSSDDDSHGWASPSAIGAYEYCARAAWYRAHGEAPERETQRVMQAGTRQHAAREAAGLALLAETTQAPRRQRVFVAAVLVLGLLSVLLGVVWMRAQ